MTAMGRKGVHDICCEACGLYTPGHQVHNIQANMASREDPRNCRDGRLVTVDDDGWIAVEVSGEVLRFWNHDPARARECFAASAGRVGLPGLGLLHAPLEGGQRYCICVSTDVPSPCVPPPPPTSDLEVLAGQLKTYGGFMVPGKTILRDLDRRRGRGRA